MSLFVILEAARLQFEITRRYPMMIVLNIIQPVAFLLIVLQGTEGRSEVFVAERLVAVVLTCFWGSIVWTAGGILRRDRMSGTLSRSLLNTHDGRLVLVGRSAGALVTSLLTLVATCALVFLLTDGNAAFPSVPRLVAGFVGVAVSGLALGLFLACALLHTRHGIAITAALMYPVFVLGGLLIPAELIPSGLRWISWLMSLSWARLFVISGGVVPLLGLLFTTAAYAGAGVWIFRRTLQRARQEGTLDLV